MKKIMKIMGISFLTNFLLSLLKLIVGVIGKSSALLADGIHSFSDLFTDIVAMIGNHFARKPADQKHPFGHGKSEYITNLIIGTVVLILGLGIISGVMNKEIVIPSAIVIYVSLFTIVFKFFLSSYLIRSGKKLKNTILVASGKESMADVISSIFVLISSILMQYADKVSFLKYADICATIVVGLFVVRTGFSILKENISVILEEQDNDIERRDNLKETIFKNKFVETIDELHLINYGPYSRLDLKVSMDGGLTLQKAHAEAHNIEEEIKKQDERIQYINIHINECKERNKEFAKK